MIHLSLCVSGIDHILVLNRDIKGANILVDQEGTVKLADFGMAKHVNAFLMMLFLNIMRIDSIDDVQKTSE